jgi:hypothetical protein
MHSNYAKDGFVAMSVSLDRPTNEKAMKNVRQFLKEQKATFANYVLNEEAEFWQEKFGIGGPPCVFVFGRDGKLAKKFDTAGAYEDVQKLVPELLKKQ